MGTALPQPIHQLLDRLRLIPLRLKWAYKLECSHDSLRPGCFVLSFDSTIVHKTIAKGSSIKEVVPGPFLNRAEKWHFLALSGTFSRALVSDLPYRQ